MGISLSLSIIACKLTRALLRLTGKGGTALPGKLARRICPSVLRRTCAGVRIIVVTGTNGKTSTCRMIEQILRDQGIDPLVNRSGANLASGITAQFAAAATLGGRPKYSWAVIECDEGALKQVAADLSPELIVVTNLFRDQLDRYGEVTSTLESIRLGVERAPRARLCLNADCSLVASLDGSAGSPAVFYGLDTDLDSADPVSDADRCLKCGAKYEYRYHTYGHLGSFFCPVCGYSRPEPAVRVTEILSADAGGSRVRMSVGERELELELSLPAVYNVYNAASAMAAAMALGLDMEAAARSLGHVQSGFGRQESFQLGDTAIRMILVKNPVGFNQAIRFISRLEEDFDAVFCLNDNIADGTDVSWIWDADCEMLARADHMRGVSVWGTRAYDMGLRLHYAGVEGDIAVRGSLEELMDYLAKAGRSVYIIPNYTSMLTLRAELSRRCSKGKFWE